MDLSETIVIYDLKLATDDRSDKRFLLTSKFCPLGLSAPDLRLYTFIQCMKKWMDGTGRDGNIVCIKVSCEDEHSFG